MRFRGWVGGGGCGGQHLASRSSWQQRTLCSALRFTRLLVTTGLEGVQERERERDESAPVPSPPLSVCHTDMSQTWHIQSESLGFSLLGKRWFTGHGLFQSEPAARRYKPTVSPLSPTYPTHPPGPSLMDLVCVCVYAGVSVHVCVRACIYAFALVFATVSTLRSRVCVGPCL